MKKIIRVLSGLFMTSPPSPIAMSNTRQKNMADVFNVIATRPSQQRALPRFLRRSDRSSLRNRNRWEEYHARSWLTATVTAVFVLCIVIFRTCCNKIANTTVSWQRPSQRTFPCQLVDTTPWQSRSKVLYYNMTTERETGWLTSNTTVEK